jgi:hypothetical protein
MRGRREIPRGATTRNGQGDTKKKSQGGTIRKDHEEQPASTRNGKPEITKRAR